jgi:MFS family permease
MLHRNAGLFVAVSLISGFGATAMSITAGVWVMSLTGSPGLAGLAALFVYLPSLAGPVLGVAVDRFPRKRVLIGTNLAMGLLLLTLLAVRSGADVWLVYAVMLGYGISFVLLDAAESAVLPAAVPGGELATLNGVRISAQEGTKLIAPLAGAGLFAWAGGPPVAVLSAGLLVVSAVLYGQVRLADPPLFEPADLGLVASQIGQTADISPRSAGRGRAAAGRLWTDTVAGVRALAAHHPLPVLTFGAGATIALSGLATPAMFAVVDEGLHRPAAFMGVLAAVQGAGSIAGGLVAGRLITARGEVVASAAGAFLFAAGTVLRAVPTVPCVVAGGLVAGIGLPWTVVAVVTALQRRVPGEVLGRASATANSLMFAPTALAIPLGALALAYTGYRWVMVVSAVATAAVGGAVLARR